MIFFWQICTKLTTDNKNKNNDKIMNENEKNISADTESTVSANTENTVSADTESTVSADTENKEDEPEVDEKCLEKAMYMLMKLNMGTDKTKEALVSQGFSEEQADLCITRVVMLNGLLGDAAEKAAKKEMQAESNKLILIGIGCIILGVVATMISYNMASPGGRFRAWWGIAVYGLYALGKGIYYKFK